VDESALAPGRYRVWVSFVPTGVFAGYDLANLKSSEVTFTYQPQDDPSLVTLTAPAGGDVVPAPHVAFAWETPAQAMPKMMIHIERQDAAGSFSASAGLGRYDLDPSDFMLVPGGIYRWHLSSDGQRVSEQLIFRHVPSSMVALEQPVGGSTVTRTVPELTWRYQHLPERIDPDRLTGNEPISVQYFAEHIDSGRFLAWKAQLPAVSLDGNAPSAGYSQLPRTGELRPDADRSEVVNVDESALAPGRYRVWVSFVPTGVFAGYDLANLKSSEVTFTYQPAIPPGDRLVTLTRPDSLAVFGQGRDVDLAWQYNGALFSDANFTPAVDLILRRTGFSTVTIPITPGANSASFNADGSTENIEGAASLQPDNYTWSIQLNPSRSIWRGGGESPLAQVTPAQLESNQSMFLYMQDMVLLEFPEDGGRVQSLAPQFKWHNTLFIATQNELEVVIEHVALGGGVLARGQVPISNGRYADYVDLGPDFASSLVTVAEDGRLTLGPDDREGAQLRWYVTLAGIRVSDIHTFTNVSPSFPVSLDAPAREAVVTEDDVEFRWTKSLPAEWDQVTTARQYLMLATTPDILRSGNDNGAIELPMDATSHTLDLAGLEAMEGVMKAEAGKRYYWGIFLVRPDTVGLGYHWVATGSETSSFVYGENLDYVTLESPANDVSRGQGGDFGLFEWAPANLPANVDRSTLAFDLVLERNGVETVFPAGEGDTSILLKPDDSLLQSLGYGFDAAAVRGLETGAYHWYVRYRQGALPAFLASQPAESLESERRAVYLINRADAGITLVSPGTAPDDGEPEVVRSFATTFSWRYEQPVPIGGALTLSITRRMIDGTTLDIPLQPDGNGQYPTSYTLTPDQQTQLEMTGGSDILDFGSNTYEGALYSWTIKLNGADASNVLRFDNAQPRLTNILVAPDDGNVVPNANIDFSWSMDIPTGYENLASIRTPIGITRDRALLSADPGTTRAVGGGSATGDVAASPLDLFLFYPSELDASSLSVDLSSLAGPNDLNLVPGQRLYWSNFMLREHDDGKIWAVRGQDVHSFVYESFTEYIVLTGPPVQANLVNPTFSWYFENLPQGWDAGRLPVLLAFQEEGTTGNEMHFVPLPAGTLNYTLDPTDVPLKQSAMYSWQVFIDTNRMTTMPLGWPDLPASALASEDRIFTYVGPTTAAANQYIVLEAPAEQATVEGQPTFSWRYQNLQGEVQPADFDVSLIVSSSTETEYFSPPTGDMSFTPDPSVWAPVEGETYQWRMAIKIERPLPELLTNNPPEWMQSGTRSFIIGTAAEEGEGDSELPGDLVVDVGEGEGDGDTCTVQQTNANGETEGGFFALLGDFLSIFGLEGDEKTDGACVFNGDATAEVKTQPDDDTPLPAEELNPPAADDPADGAQGGGDEVADGGEEAADGADAAEEKEALDNPDGFTDPNDPAPTPEGSPTPQETTDEIPVTADELTFEEDENGNLRPTNGTVSGEIEEDDQPSFNLVPNLTLTEFNFDAAKQRATVGGKLALGGDFECEGQPIDIATGDALLDLRLSGTFDGTIKFDLGCPVDLGPFEAALNDTRLEFKGGSNGQTVRLHSSATLQVTEDYSVTGSVVYNFMSGDWEELNFALDQPFVWTLPEEGDPILSFRIERAEIGKDGLLIDGRNKLVLPGQNEIGVTFDELLVDLGGGGIKSGKMLFDQGFAFEVGMLDRGDAADSLTYRAIPNDDDVSVNPGFYLGLGNAITIDKDGFHISGKGTARFKYDGLNIDEDLSATFEDDFRFGLGGFDIENGVVRFSWDDLPLAYADADGFHLDPNWLAAVLPERIPLPSEEAAYLVLKDSSNAYVDYDRQADGTLKIMTKPNESVALVVPALQGTQAEPPRLNVTFSDLVITPGGEVQLGSVSATVAPDDPAFDFTQIGLPIAIRELNFDRDASGTFGLSVAGPLALFDRVIDPNTRVELAIDPDGGIRGSVNVPALDGRVDLVRGFDQVALEPSSVVGGFERTAMGDLEFDFNMIAQFTVTDDTGALVVGAELDGRYSKPMGSTQYNLSLTTTGPVQPAQPEAIDFDFFAFAIDEVTSLSLTYDPVNDFQFDAEFDASIVTRPTVFDEFAVPLLDLSLTEDGFTIPPQDVNESSVPGLDLPPFNAGSVEFKPTAFRTSATVTFDWSQGSVDLDDTLDPRFDFIMKLPDLYGTNPNTYDFTFLDVGFEDGILEGSVLYSPPNGEAVVTVPLGSPSAAPPALAITEVNGLLQNLNGVQDYSFGIRGHLVAGEGPFVPDDPANCVYTDFDLLFVEGPGFEGTVNAAPCGRFEAGPVSFAVLNTPEDPTVITFAFTDGEQTAILDGSVEATIAFGGNATPLIIQGDLDMDLMTGEITDGALFVSETFTAPLPLDAANPAFTLEVSEARLDKEGFTFRSSGTFGPPEARVTITYDDLTFDLSTGAVESGSATLAAGLALQSAINPIGFAPVDTTVAFTDDGFRFVVDSSIRLDSLGLHLTGDGRGSLRGFGQDLAGLRLAFENDDDANAGFTLGLDPFDVTEGRADVYVDLLERQAGTPLLYLDRTGFNFNTKEALASIVPDTLYLPSRDVAYIVLRDPVNDELRIDTTASKIGTKPNMPVDLVIPALSDYLGQTPIQVSFSATRDDAFNIVVDSLAILPGAPVDLPNLPVQISKLIYKRTEALPFRIAGLIDLPDILEDAQQPLEVEIEVGEDGFAGTVVAGIYSPTFDPDQVEQDPILALNYPENDPQTTVAVRGIKLTFAPNTTPVFDLSGDFTTQLLQREVNGQQEPVYLHYAGGYNAQNGWSLSGETSHLPGTIPMQVAQLDPDANGGIAFTIDETTFVVSLSGTFSVPDVLDDFAITVQGLELGIEKTAQGVSLIAELESAANGSVIQTDLFGGLAALEIPKQGASFGFGTAFNAALPDGIFGVQLTGELTAIADDPVTFTNMLIGADGTFAFDEVAVTNIDIIDDHLTLTKLGLSKPVDATSVSLFAEAKATLPAPFRAATQGVKVGTDPNTPADGTALMKVQIGEGPDGNIVPTIEGPLFVLDSGFEIGNNSATEYELGDFATMDLTGFGVDLNLGDPQRSPAIYVSAALYLDNKTEKRIEIGKASDLRNTPGIRVELANAGLCQVGTNVGGVCIDYNISAVATEADPLFELDAGFFDVKITSLTLDPVQGDPLRLVIGGSAGFDVQGVVGRAGYDGFTVGNSGVEDWGRLARGGQFAILPTSEDEGLISLELGGFITQIGGLIDIESGSQSSTQTGVGGSGIGVALQTAQVAVKRFIHFRNDLGGNALKIAFGDEDFGIAASVEEVLFYETDEGANSTTKLLIKRAALEVHDMVSVEANFEYINGPDGFLVRLSGRGQFGAPGSQMGLMAVGKFATLGGKLSFGVFVAIQTPRPIPIIPAIIELQEVGGGFFLRPDPTDFQLVRQVVQLNSDPYLENARDRVINANPALFSIQLYARVGLVGQEPLYALDAKALITVTNHYFMLDLDAQFYGLPKENLIASLVVAVEFSPAALSADVLVNASFGAAAEGRLEVNFFANQNTWGIVGKGNLTILKVLNMNGDLVIADEGFYMGLGLSVNIDAGLISIKGSLLVEVWNVQNGSFGGYVEASVKIPIPFDELSASGKGAFIGRGSGYMMYAQGSVRAFGTDWSGWASLENGDWDSGTGSNERYERMVAEARAEAQDLKNKANEAATKLAEAQAEMENVEPEPPPIQRNSQETLRKAGFNLIIEMDDAQRQQLVTGGYGIVPGGIGLQQNEYQAYFNLTGSGDNRLGSGLRWVRDKVILGEYFDGAARPTRDAYEEAGVDMEDQLDVVSFIVPIVSQRLAEAESELATLVQDLSTQADAFTDLASPVTATTGFSTDASGNVTGGPSFSVDQGEVLRQQGLVNDEQVDIAERDAQYRDAILSALRDLRQFDEAASGRSMLDTEGLLGALGGGGGFLGIQFAFSVSDAAQQFTQAISNIREYYAQKAKYVWDLGDFVNNRIAYLDISKRFEITNAINDATRINNINNTFQVGRLKNVNLGRQRIISHLAGEGDAGVASLQARQDDYQAAPVQRDSLQAQFRQTAQELWQEMPLAGLRELQAVLPDAQPILDEYTTTLSAINTAYFSFSEQVNDLYALKAEYATTLYGMMDEYQRWRTSTFGTPPSQLVTDQLADLAEALEPPRIERISVNVQNNLDNMGRATLSWSIETPWRSSAQVVETSISIEPRSGSAQSVDLADAGRFYSVGVANENTKNDVNQWELSFPKASATQEKQSYAVVVRGRSSGGLATVRAAAFDVAMNRRYNNQSTGGGGFNMPITAPDNTPPNIIFWDLFSSRTNGQGQDVEYGRVKDGTLWIHDLRSVRFRAVATDWESDVPTYEYAVVASGTTPSFSDWKPLIGSRLLLGADALSVLSNAAVNGEINSLVLTPGQPYQVHLRVTNGVDLRSTRVFNKEVVFDPNGPSAPDVSEPPTFAEVANRPSATANSSVALGNTPNINVPVPNEAPRYSGRIDWMQPQINRVTLVGAVPRATAAWTASTDDFAGVWRYEYVLSREPDANAAFGGGDPIETTTDTQVVLDGHPMLSYTEPTYFHVRGVDNGRALGPASTLELLPEDKSAPTRPTITLRPDAQSIAVHVIQLAHDPESGIAGYQLALGTQLGAQDIRPFPADSTAMDIEHNPLTNLPTKVTFSKNGLPASGPLYVSIRAVNGQGGYSWRTASGPLRMDDTPARVPGAEILSLTRSTSGGLGQARERMRVQFSNIRDLESGITWARVQEVRVGGKRIAVDQFSSTLNVVPPTQTAAVFSNGRYTVDLTLDQSDVVQSLEGLFLSLLARTKPEN
ncbi:MAG: hypothetical protein AAGJ10_17325, partial [Bacteroidota bacterium]